MSSQYNKDKHQSQTILTSNIKQSIWIILDHKVPPLISLEPQSKSKPFPDHHRTMCYSTKPLLSKKYISHWFFQTILDQLIFNQITKAKSHSFLKISTSINSLATIALDSEFVKKNERTRNRFHSSEIPCLVH